MPDEQLTNTSEELNRLSFRRQQLMDKRNILAMLIQFKRNNGQNEQQYSRETEELKEIDEQLNILSEKKIQLENRQRSSGRTHIIDTTVSTDVIIIESPPPYPAPRVILDVQQLPRHSSQTQCPDCHQFVTTDVTTKAGSATYIVCLISILFCCVAGCCVIPFCVDGCKDVVHKCPKCRSHIITCKKL
ncbi:lipopolysaccharide-induced tumor necrosis factor-alpha factor homolog [Carassius carassius]|uniref:lipopolysaccharide-induced tumor necrosis factor-alpha factor homolog n=1 Tax=Carassius carassius TaxID=217509 RepID=UPI002868A444|nr:lipopolysaccharide-induced tumor necrosis factor-alpha factor homolog [Carassius carassius]